MIRQLKCPVCGSVLDRKKIRASEAFPCVSCGEKLQIYDSFSRIGYAVALLLSGILSAAMGLGGIVFVVATAVLSIPISAALGAALAVLVPPKIGRYVPEHFTLFPR